MCFSSNDVLQLFHNLCMLHAQECIKIYLFHGFKKRIFGTVSLHGISHDGFCKWFGASWLSHKKKRNSELDTNHHHEDILLQRGVSGYVFLQIDIV